MERVKMGGISLDETLRNMEIIDRLLAATYKK